MHFDFTSIAAYISGLILILVFGRIFIRPIKWLIRLILNGLLGGFVLVLLKFIGFPIAANPLSCLFIALLGFPGIILVILLQFFL